MKLSLEEYQAGRGTTLQRMPWGVARGAKARTREYRHEWQVFPYYSFPARRWVALLEPGYVNGEAPIYRTSMREQTQQGQDFGVNPLSGQAYFSSPIFAKEKSGPPQLRTLEIPLYLQPAIPLEQWRDAGVVGDPEAGSVRQRKALDVILHQPREALTSTISFEPGALTGQAFARQVLTTRPPAADDVLRIYAGQYRPAQGIDPLAAQFEEPTWDELVVATVYVISPIGAPATAKPDGTWVSEVAPELFWNLSWIPAPLFQPVDVSDQVNPLAGLGALGAGLLLPIVNTFSGLANDIYQDALNTITGKSQAGTWWTTTGGGTESQVRPTARPAAAGNDKAARALAIVQAAARARIEAAQRGGFPWRGISFDHKRLTSGRLPLST